MAAVRARAFDYAVTLDTSWTATSDRGGEPLPHDERAWTPEHLLLVALARCSLTSLLYHARRAGLTTEARTDARGTVTVREADGRFAFVEIAVDAQVSLDAGAGRARACARCWHKAERDCFVGASLTVTPVYRWTVNGEDDRVSAVETLDVDAVRARFTALQRRLAFFDGPGGTQCPDEVIDAIARYLREDNANVGAPYATSRAYGRARRRSPTRRPPSFMGCTAGEVAFGPSMTSLNFLFTRALARELQAGDEVVVTALDHDANVAPWLQLQEDLGIVVRIADVRDDLSLDLDLVARAAHRPHPRGRLPGRGELGRHRARRPQPSSSSRTTPARSPGWMPSTTGRTARSTSPPGTPTWSSARRTSSSARTWGSPSARTS